VTGNTILSPPLRGARRLRRAPATPAPVRRVAAERDDRHSPSRPPPCPTAAARARGQAFDHRGRRAAVLTPQAATARASGTGL